MAVHSAGCAGCAWGCSGCLQWLYTAGCAGRVWGCSGCLQWLYTVQDVRRVVVALGIGCAPFVRTRRQCYVRQEGPPPYRKQVGFAGCVWFALAVLYLCRLACVYQTYIRRISDVYQTFIKRISDWLAYFSLTPTQGAGKLCAAGVQHLCWLHVGRLRMCCFGSA